MTFDTKVPKNQSIKSSKDSDLSLFSKKTISKKLGPLGWGQGLIKRA